MLRIGCGLIAYAPSCSFLIMFSERPQLIIIALGSAFAWLCSALATAMLWTIFQSGGVNLWPLLVILSAVFQEISRFVFVYAYRRTETLIKRSSPHSNEAFPLNDISSSLAAGFESFLLRRHTFLGRRIFLRHHLRFCFLLLLEPAGR